MSRLLEHSEKKRQGLLKMNVMNDVYRKCTETGLEM